MAYFIEFGLSRHEGLYCEFAIVNKTTRGLLSGSGIDHQFRIYRGRGPDYGFGWGASQLIASNSNGLITEPVPGVQAVNIPPEMFGLEGGFCDYGFVTDRRVDTLNCKMLAVPSDPSFTKLLFNGTISFGDRAMPCPRVTLSVYPLYPVAPPATSPENPTVSQVKMQLAALGVYDTVEAALGPPTSSASICWATGGTVSLAGPLASIISTALEYNLTAMISFLAAAAALST